MSDDVDRRLNIVVPNALKKRLDNCTRIHWGMKKILVTVLLSDALDKLEAEDGLEYLKTVLERFEKL